MAVYVTSDIHGHLRALDRALELAQPGAGDRLVFMGDMVDRGPDPVGVLKLARDYPGATVLKGNHEELMLGAVAGGDEADTLIWQSNGGYVTSCALDGLPAEEAAGLVDWVAGLPSFAVAEVDDSRLRSLVRRRRYILAHAGIDAPAARAELDAVGVQPGCRGGYGEATSDELIHMMSLQSEEDLLWIRGDFWARPTGLVGGDGLGPVVVAGHTPSVSLARYARLMCGPGIDEHDRGRMVEVGPTRDTGGEADRICVDCSAAAGYPFGRVGIMRLEDRRVWYADVEEGE